MDPEEIYREVARRQERAKSLGICEAVLSLFNEHLSTLAIWIGRFPQLVHPCISELTQTDRETFSATINNSPYVFNYSEKSFFAGDGDATMGKMIVKAGEQVVLEFHTHVHYPSSQWGEIEYSIGDIDSFIEGKWVAELQPLPSVLGKHKDAQLAAEDKRQKESPEKLDDLRKKFGL